MEILIERKTEVRRLGWRQADDACAGKRRGRNARTVLQQYQPEIDAWRL